MDSSKNRREARDEQICQHFGLNAPSSSQKLQAVFVRDWDPWLVDDQMQATGPRDSQATQSWQAKRDMLKHVQAQTVLGHTGPAACPK